MAASNAPRPGRTLTVMALVIAALYAAMFVTGDTTPRLGLDLQGGTSVILQPRTASGGAVPQRSLDQAVEIIRQRVNGLGVAESEVQTQGDNIVVSVPGATDQEAVQLVASTAQLRFRPVIQVGAPTPATPEPAATPAATPAPTAPAPTAPASPAAGTPAATPAATPSPATTQQRPVPQALRAQTPAPTEPAPTEPAPTTPAPTAGAQVTPQLQQQFNALDCTKPESRRGTGGSDRADQPIVACQRDGAEKYILGPTAVEGQNVDTAAAEVTQSTNNWVVTLDFDSVGTRQFADTTTRLVSQGPPQNQFGIVLDGVVISAPVVNEPITAGQAQISGDFTQQDAEDLANVLRYGALPLSFDQGEVNTISPTLGSDQLRGGLFAGAIGLGLVLVYSLLYYRGLGLVTVLSLVVAGALTYATVVLLGKTIGFTLTLAGIAGLIVAIGITADSFVVYFERLRDEVREGKSIRLAAEHGWVRARRTILAADFVSFLAAVVLYLLSVGGVRGFAFTLGLTTLIDVVVVFLFTKPLVTLLVRTRFFGGGHKLSGLDAEHIGGARPSALTPRRRAAAGAPAPTTGEA